MVVSKKDVLPFLYRTKKKRSGISKGKAGKGKLFQKNKIIYAIRRHKLLTKFDSYVIATSKLENQKKNSLRIELAKQLHLEEDLYPRLENVEHSELYVGYGKRVYYRSEYLYKNPRELERDIVSSEEQLRGLDLDVASYVNLHSEAEGTTEYLLARYNDTRYNDCVYYPLPKFKKKLNVARYGWYKYNSCVYYPPRPYEEEDRTIEGINKYVEKTKPLALVSKIINVHKNMALNHAYMLVNQKNVLGYVRNMLMKKGLSSIMIAPYLAFTNNLYSRLNRVFWKVDYEREIEIAKQKFLNRGLNEDILNEIINYLRRITNYRFE